MVDQETLPRVLSEKGTGQLASVLGTDLAIRLTNKRIVFVYGTLKQGFGNNRLLRGTDYLFPAVTAQCFTMTTRRYGFPYVMPEAEGYYHLSGHIKGEAYALPFDADGDRILQSLDLLEGHPKHYVRTPINIIPLDENERMYWMNVDEPGDYAKVVTVPADMYLFSHTGAHTMLTDKDVPDKKGYLYWPQPTKE